jgi:hypothetical protein
MWFASIFTKVYRSEALTDFIYLSQITKVEKTYIKIMGADVLY